MWKTLGRDEAPERAPVEKFVYSHATSVLPAIDVLVARYAGRELVSGAEVVDLLLDLRLLAEADELVASKS
jgi:hypothetical protein